MCIWICNFTNVFDNTWFHQKVDCLLTNEAFILHIKYLFFFFLHNLLRCQWWISFTKTDHSRKKIDVKNVTHYVTSTTFVFCIWLQPWKSDLTSKMKRSFFQAAVVSILLYGCTTWTLTKRLEKKLDGNYTRMLRAILNKSWRQHPTKHQLYGHLHLITKTIQVKRTRHAGHRWRSRDELISDVPLWTLTYGRAKAGRPARTFIQQLCDDTGCSPEDLPEAMNDRE